MHAAIRQYQVDPGSVDEIRRGVNEGLLPIIKDVYGFQAYYAIDAGGGRMASVSVFEDRAGAEGPTRLAGGGGGRMASVSVFEDGAGAEESTRMSADWIRQNMASLVPNPPEVLEGEVFADEAASAGPVSGVTDTGRGGPRRGRGGGEGEGFADEAASAGPVSGVTDTVGGVTEPVSGVTDTVGGATESVRGVTDKLLGGEEKNR